MSNTSMKIRDRVSDSIEVIVLDSGDIKFLTRDNFNQSIDVRVTPVQWEVLKNFIDSELKKES